MVAGRTGAIQTGDDFLGVDLGIVNLATDSDGDNYSGADVERKRRAMPAVCSPALWVNAKRPTYG